MFKTNYVAEFHHDKDEEQNGNKSHNYIIIHDSSVLSLFSPSAYSFVKDITVTETHFAMNKATDELKRRNENHIEVTPSFAMSAFFHAELAGAAVNAHEKIDSSIKEGLLQKSEKAKAIVRETGFITKKMEVNLAKAAVELVAKEKPRYELEYSNMVQATSGYSNVKQPYEMK